MHKTLYNISSGHVLPLPMPAGAHEHTHNVAQYTTLLGGSASGSSLDKPAEPL